MISLWPVRPALLLVAAAVAVTLGPAGPGAAHDGHGPAFVSIAQLEYDPNPARIATGDSVIWQWDGPDRNHSVTADDGSFDSDPGKTSGISHSASDSFAHTFNNPGTWTYHCKVHTFMRASVEVTGTPVGQADTTPPGIRGLTVKRARRTALVRASLSEDVFVTLRVRRGTRTAATHRYEAGAGPFARRIPIRRLRRGRYTLIATARDKAGNASEPARATLRIP